MATARLYRRAVFLALATPELAIERVAQRVKQGGHNIPEDIIRRRFAAGRRNFDLHYKALVNTWALFDNTNGMYELIEEGEN